MAEEGVSPDPGLVLRELIQLRYQGNVTALARVFAGPRASKKEIDQWRNYINRWKRLRTDPNRHEPSDQHLQRLAVALEEPADLLRLLWTQDRVHREIVQARDQLSRLAETLRRREQP